AWRRCFARTDAHASSTGEIRHNAPLDQITTGGLAQRRLDSRAQRRLDQELVVDPSTAATSGSSGDPSRLLLGQARLERRESALHRGKLGARAGFAFTQR